MSFVMQPVKVGGSAASPPAPSKAGPITQRFAPPNQSNFLVPILTTIGSKVIDTVVDRIIPNENDTPLNPNAPSTPPPTQFLPPTPLVPQSCPEGFVRNPSNGVCEFIGSPGDRSTGGQSQNLPVVFSGEMVAGRFGAGMMPTPVARTTLVCPPGMKLGKDDICYDRISNRDRKHPKGRKPLLTGGEMNAITKAARAAKRLKSTEKKLAKLGRGLAPKRSSGRSRSAPPSRRLSRPTVEAVVIDTD